LPRRGNEETESSKNSRTPYDGSKQKGFPLYINTHITYGHFDQMGSNFHNPQHHQNKIQQTTDTFNELRLIANVSLEVGDEATGDSVGNGGFLLKL